MFFWTKKQPDSYKFTQLEREFREEVISYRENQKKNEELLDILLGRKSGFEDLPKERMCNHPEHNPPSLMVVPDGKRYRHICPECGAKAYLEPIKLSY